jgi:hypothetical protein
MTMQPLPVRERGSAPDLVEKAKTYRYAGELVRFEMVTGLIANSRSFWRGNEEEIIEAAGYENVNEYWHVALSEPMTAAKFVNLLARNLIDPRSAQANYWRRVHITNALELARKTSQAWLFQIPHVTAVYEVNEEPGEPPANDNPATVIAEMWMLHPRSAVEWFLSLPKRRNLIPPALRDFVESKQQVKPQQRLTKERPPARVSSAELKAFMLEFHKINPTVPVDDIYVAARDRFGKDRVSREQVRTLAGDLKTTPHKTGPRGPRKSPPPKDLN